MCDTFASRLKTDLTGKVAVITGAGSELGLELALCAAGRGMKVALLDADPTLLAAAHQVVRSNGVETWADCARQFDLASLQELAPRIETELGPPWLACNSANGPTIESNLWSVLNGVQVFAAGIVMRGSGHIVNIASEDLFGIRGAAVDVAVNHAIVGLSKSLYCELESLRSPVGVTLVCPTLINTNITGTSHTTPLSARDRGLSVVPPDELAEQIFAAIDRRDFWVSSHAPAPRRSHCAASARVAVA